MKSNHKLLTGNIGSKFLSCGIFKFLSVFLRYLEKFIEYLTYNAYTVINIEGYPFCKAAKKAFEIIIHNPLRIIAINTLGDFVLFLSQVFVTLLTVTSTVLIKVCHNLQLYALITENIIFKCFKERSLKIFKSSLNSEQIGFLIIVALISYLVARNFFNIYENVIDAIMVLLKGRKEDKKNLIFLLFG
jgi:solute carrier family 44 protein 1 (choline transporter-like protein)